jgi:hypothetical protein
MPKMITPPAPSIKAAAWRLLHRWGGAELRGANGERWHIVRGPRSYVFGQRHADWHVFDGWRCIEWPLPAPGRPRDHKPPDWVRWRHEGGDGVFDLPARPTGLILEQYGQVLYINQMAPSTSPTWLIGEIVSGP